MPGADEDTWGWHPYLGGGSEDDTTLLKPHGHTKQEPQRLIHLD